MIRILPLLFLACTLCSAEAARTGADPHCAACRGALTPLQLILKVQRSQCRVYVCDNGHALFSPDGGVTFIKPDETNVPFVMDKCPRGGNYLWRGYIVAGRSGLFYAMRCTCSEFHTHFRPYRGDP